MSRLRAAFVRWCERRVQRPPDKVILKADGSPYLVRWHVITRNRLLNIYWHEFLQSDEDKANHDHPWLFNASFYIQGDYLEIVGEKVDGGAQFRMAGDTVFRWGKSPHRVQLLSRWRAGVEHLEPVTTIFLTGPVVRHWGFYCPKGWVHWKQFVELSDDGKTSAIRGCE